MWAKYVYLTHIPIQLLAAIGHKKAVGSTEAVKDKMEDVSLENYCRADDTLFEV